MATPFYLGATRIGFSVSGKLGRLLSRLTLVSLALCYLVTLQPTGAVVSAFEGYLLTGVRASSYVSVLLKA